MPSVLRGFVLSALVFVLSPSPARGELAYFVNGGFLSIKGHHVEGGSLVLELRAGGEIVCEPSSIARITPDEVPYPEPEPAQGAAADDRLTEAPFGTMIDRAAREHGVDPRLVRAVIQAESGYDVKARSPKGAMGLMQLMPATALEYRLTDPYDPEANIDAGTRHLRTLLERYPMREALAAYNAGEAAVERFGGVPPYAETRTYVSRVLRLARISDR